MPAVKHSEAESMMRETGARITRARVEVLAVLLAAERALSHHDVEARLSLVRAIDRVTVYRVLDWLSDQGLAHKIAGEDRIWRYNAAERARSQSHAHFQCERCSAVICLDDPHDGLRVRVPRGFVTREVALTVKGFCAKCVGASGGRRERVAHERH
jgi:Fur family ferric uptake transcriptional regulator